MSSWHPPKFGYVAWKYVEQVLICCAVASDAGTSGNPILHVGGEQDAVMAAAPGDVIVRPQDWVHPLAVAMAPGFDEVQVKGIFVRTTAPFVFGNELFPMTSVTVAIAVCALPPFAMFTFV
jgi:hypothetical protein